MRTNASVVERHITMIRLICIESTACFASRRDSHSSEPNSIMKNSVARESRNETAILTKQTQRVKQTTLH